MEVRGLSAVQQHAHPSPFFAVGIKPTACESQYQIMRSTGRKSKTFMATEVNTSNSSWFRVKDPDTFKVWASNRSIAVAARIVDGNTQFMIYPEAMKYHGLYPCDDAGWHTCCKKDDEDDFAEPEFIADELSQHLLPGTAAVLKEFSSLKLDWSAYAIVVRADGEMTAVSLDDGIRKATESLGVTGDIQW